MLKLKRASAVDRIHQSSGTEWLLTGNADDLIDLVTAVNSNEETEADLSIMEVLAPLAHHFRTKDDVTPSDTV